MTNTPLTSNDHGRLFFFALMILPTTALGFGVIPLLIIIFGMFMMRRTRDFSHIETAARNFKIYFWLFLLGFAAAATYRESLPLPQWELENRSSQVHWLCSCAGIAAVYILAVNLLFLNPLRRHRNWVEQNGIFSGRIQAAPERLRTISVADELLKWVKLKEGGHISEEEFNEARATLLLKS